jgi:hypothetical protein
VLDALNCTPSLFFPVLSSFPLSSLSLFFFVVLGLELRAYTLSHSTSLL